MTKRCPRCGETKPTAEFHKNKARKDGIAPYCKDCARVYNQEKQYQIKWQKKNRDKVYGYNAKWRERNPERWREINNNGKYRGRSRAAVSWPKGGWELLLGFYNSRCLKCGVVDRLELDHVIPLSQGGDHALWNAQILCRSCNASKGSRRSDDYRGGRILVASIP